MTDNIHRLKDQNKYPCRPYENLYIYYLQGRLKPDHKIFGSDFIGNWQEDGFSFLFFTKPSPNEIANVLNSNPGLSLLEEFHMTYDQWQGERIAPLRIGRFHIVPPWERTPEKMNGCHEERPIILDPGVVFGNGLHATTQDCLKALELAFLLDRIESALDLGTGTGILALAASRLGCKNILAVDFNFLAAHTALRNICLNGLENRILVAQGRAEDFIDSTLDLVIANIHYDVMKRLTASQGFFNKKWFILSGLLRSQAKEVRFSLLQKGVKIIKNWEYNGVWHTFLGKKE